MIEFHRSDGFTGSLARLPNHHDCAPISQDTMLFSPIVSSVTHADFKHSTALFRQALLKTIRHLHG